MFARFFAWGLTACLIGCALCGCNKTEPPAPDEPAVAQPPVNVLLITLDTTRADHIGCYGSATARTPALDGLAAGGVRFDQAFSHVPLTSPSHVSLMTGTYPAVNGVRTNGMSVSESDISTLAEQFKTAGYQTGAFVAAFVLHARFGLNRGFDHYDDDLRDAQTVSGEMLERRGDRVCDSALAWLDQHASGPFFAWVHFFDPHSPYAPPEPYGSEFSDPYDGEIAFTDAQVQRLVTWLDEKKLRERTLIVVAGDHGEAFGEHGETQHGYFIYEPTQHVPLIFALPSRVPTGKVVTAPVGLVDVFPTLMELMQWEGPSTLDGRSLVDVWKSSRAVGRPVYAESESPRLNYAWARLRSLTTAEWKYIDAPNAELYDRRMDPGEMHNVIADHAEDAARLKKALQELVATMRPRYSGTTQLDSAARRRLESLGYAGAGAPVVADSDDRPGRDPKDMLLIYQAHLKAIELLRAGKVAEVIRILEPVIGECSESSLMQQTLGRAYLEVGRLAEAQKAYEVSLRQSPHDAQKLLGLAEALRQQNKNRDAKEWFLRALAVEPDLAEAHRGLGLVYSATGDLPNAEKCFRRHVEISSESTNALSNLANALMLQQKYAEAAPVFEKMIRIDPKDENAHRACWQALMGAGRRADAIRALRAACDVMPNDANLYCSLAWYLSIGLEGEGGSPEATVQLGLRCRDANPRSPRTWDILAAAYASAGEFPEAIQAAKKALSIAQELGKQPIAAQIAARLRLYESNRPFRQ
ncbi:MAG: sulfatase-like hydrolase/transferase [Phycisphaerae bacterium]